MPITIDVGVSLGLPLDQLVRRTRELEAMGFDGIGVSDHLEHFGRDGYLALALMAANTSHAVLGMRATNAVTRHPFVLATMVNTLNELAPGRISMSFATGDRGVHPTGMKPATVAAMRQAVTTIRRLLRGETVAAGENGASLKIDVVAGPPPHIGVTASGHRMMQLAGEVGEGAVLLTGLDPRMLTMAQRNLEIGAQRSGRSLAGFRATHYLVVSVDDDLAVARERVRRSLHTWLRQGLYNAAMEAIGMEVPVFERPEDIPHDLLVRLSDMLFVVARPGELVERFEELSRRGVKHVAAMVTGGPQVSERVLDLLARQVMPRVN